MQLSVRSTLAAGCAAAVVAAGAVAPQSVASAPRSLNGIGHPGGDVGNHVQHCGAFV